MKKLYGYQLDRGYRATFVSPDQLAKARGLMRLGYDPQNAALTVGVLFRDLDRALWRDLGETRKPEPMF